MAFSGETHGQAVEVPPVLECPALNRLSSFLVGLPVFSGGSTSVAILRERYD
jgi:hypothetical protein